MSVVTTDLEGRVRISLDLPQGLQERIRQAIQRGVAKSQNALIVQAVEEYLAQLEREWVDAQFAEMEHDEGYQALNRQVKGEFARSDWESLQTVEGGRATNEYL